MRITNEQEDILKSFKCERLSSNEENKELIKKFTSARGKGLVDYLKQKGWNEDINGEKAFYIIKDKDNNPYLFFSLKCGVLFEPLDEKKIARNVNEISEKIDFLYSSSEHRVTTADIYNLIKHIGEQNNVSMEEARDILIHLFENKKKVRALDADKKRDGERPIVRVHRTLPGVELVHFCSDDNAKKLWEKYGFRFTLGQLFFWYYIVPVIENVQKLVGCQYVFLFAADPTVDESLINYYEVSLNFSKLTNIGTNKPYYDFGCEFMSQEVSSLKEYRIGFFNDFNIDDKENTV